MKKTRKLKFLIIDEYYLDFLKSFRNKYPEYTNQSFVFQRKKFLGQFFGTSDVYSYYLKKAGYVAEDLIVNDEILQRKWANEHDLNISSTTILSKLQMLPLAYKVLGRPKWIQEIVLAQVKYYKPDVIYVHNLSILNPSTLKSIKENVKLIVGQTATSFPDYKYIKCFDLILTSFPHYVERFRNLGTKSEYLKIGFDPRILKLIPKQKRIYDVSFIGSFSLHHKEGTNLLEKIAEKTKIDFWGQGLQFLSPNSPIRKNFHGEAWGLEMYKILAKSKIVINRHIGASKDYANNMRLYESTGMGAMIITDFKKNLNDLFKIEKEIVAYKNQHDLEDKILYYLTHDCEREKIAIAGQKRTIKEHNYRNRIKELIQIIEKYI